MFFVSFGWGRRGSKQHDNSSTRLGTWVFPTIVSAASTTIFGLAVTLVVIFQIAYLDPPCSPLPLDPVTAPFPPGYGRYLRRRLVLPLGHPVLPAPDGRLDHYD